MEDNTPKINPWFSIWTRPTETMQYLLSARFNWLSAVVLIVLVCFWGILDFSCISYGDPISAWKAFLAMVLIYPFVIFFWAWGIWFFQDFTKGQGSYRSIVQASFWASMISAVTGFLWVPQWLIFGSEMFTKETPVLDDSILLRYTLYGFVLLRSAGYVYGLYVLIKFLSVVQKLSMFRTLLNLIGALAIMYFFLLGIAVAWIYISY